MLDLAELISICARLRGDGAGGDGIVWAATAAHLGSGALAAPRAALREGNDLGPLEALAEGAEAALAAHAERVNFE